MTKQVDKSAYAFNKYTRIDRWSSYYYQLREILALHPHSVLEVGVGDGILRDYLKNHTVSYVSLDIAEDLSPDMVGSVTSIPAEDNSFDVVCAFEILEHLPFEHFERGLRELFRVSRKHVILSLPHFSHPILFYIKIPLLKIKFALRLPHSKVHVFDGQHYWEIGKKGYPEKRIREIVQKHGTLLSEFVPFENQSHHFFVLQKLGS